MRGCGLSVCVLLWAMLVVFQVQMLGLISVIRGFGGGIVSHALKRQESFAFR